jgi:hypothetical protein
MDKGNAQHTLKKDVHTGRLACEVHIPWQGNHPPLLDGYLSLLNYDANITFYVYN